MPDCVFCEQPAPFQVIEPESGETYDLCQACLDVISGVQS